MTIERLDTTAATWIEDPRLADYRAVRDPALVRQSARFVAEGRLVVRTLLRDSPLRAVSVLVDETAYPVLAATLEASSDVSIYVVPSGALQQIAGWRFHQGCLAVGERPAPLGASVLVERQQRPRLLVGLEALSNPDNVGAIFRSAAALGAGGVVLGPEAVSPLYRKAVRTSMGAALTLPYAHVEDWHAALDALAAEGYALLALTPAADAEGLAEVADALPVDRPRVLLLGAEGPGLTAETLARADRRVRIPMTRGTDSLNVAASAAIALFALSTA
ncbi:MAG: RNA methyltransferase [Planctomycetota bacterium]|nr:RNA methyltransferase [Planctomycetota bacterium]